MSNLDPMPQTDREVAAVMAEARRIFSNLKEAHSKGVLLCIASELRKWEWSDMETFSEDESGLRTCLMCGHTKDVLDAEVIE